MFSLQRDSSSSEEETWKNHDVAARETLQERREAIERGKLKGRRLFDSTMESESDDNDNNIGQNYEVRSMSFCYLEDEHEHENESLSSSLSPIGDFVDKDMMTNVADIKVGSKSRFANGTRYVVFLGGFVAFALLMVAMCISLGRNFWGNDFDVILVPT
ncbi:transmembrane protein, putative [Medicago truncatula]|uniref:Transmembrane protein, putative n=1 Tax=Medicago truncatula TaxID=3880 RepID=G7J3U9_MEDTR|nr:transmembrane protein, putative [Medicago truncatula]